MERAGAGGRPQGSITFINKLECFWLQNNEFSI